MTTVATALIICFGIGGVVSFLHGLQQTCQRNNPFGLTPWYWVYGIFVCADGILIGFFWAALSILSLLLQSSQLFLIALTVFWIVRSTGEILYWFLQQFAATKKDPPHTLFGQAIFPGESIWFAYQVFWQIVLVIATVYLLYLLGVF